MGVSGISSGFPLLSRSSGQVAHVLLTRSPLDLHQSFNWMDLVRLACIKHAASVRPEPGSNSPSRSNQGRSPFDPRESVSETPKSLRPTGTKTDFHFWLSVLVLDKIAWPSPTTPALAFGFLCSVFKERLRAATRVSQKRRCLPPWPEGGGAEAPALSDTLDRTTCARRAASQIIERSRRCQPRTAQVALRGEGPQ